MMALTRIRPRLDWQQWPQREQPNMIQAYIGDLVEVDPDRVQVQPGMKPALP